MSSGATPLGAKPVLPVIAPEVLEEDAVVAGDACDVGPGVGLDRPLLQPADGLDPTAPDGESDVVVAPLCVRGCEPQPAKIRPTRIMPKADLMTTTPKSTVL